MCYHSTNEVIDLNCPNCQAFCEDDLRFCDHCGADLSVCEEPYNIPVILVTEDAVPLPQSPVLPVASQPKTEPPMQPAAPKGRLWPPLVILAVMISIGTLLFFLIPLNAQSSVPNNSATESCFRLEDGVLYFQEEYYDGTQELIVPETINGMTVTAIGDYAFSGHDTITTVILPSTVTHIGDYAFSSCKSLRGIYIPDSVTTIGVYAFADCDDLEAVYFPDTIVALGHGSLDSCDSLHYILFDGTYNQWLSLYSGYFVSTVELHTIDGVYYTRP